MTKTFIQSENVVERKVRDKLILVPLKTGPARLDAIYTLNETAACLWQQLRTVQTEDTLVSRLADQFTVTETIARADVRQFLNRLLAISAVKVTEQE